jgi:hypothetical protein
LTEPSPGPERDDETPPFGGRWTVLYGIVLLNLVLIIAVCYLFTRTYE